MVSTLRTEAEEFLLKQRKLEHDLRHEEDVLTECRAHYGQLPRKATVVARDCRRAVMGAKAVTIINIGRLERELTVLRSQHS